MTRIIAIDNMRGIAFILMIIQHVFYFYDVSNYYETQLSKNIIIEYSGSIARSLFIFLAGCSLVLNYKKNKKKFIKNKINRSLEILIHAGIISYITFFYYPEFFVRFGILHFIGVASLLCSFIAPYPNLYLFFIMCLIFMEPPKINTFIDTITGASTNFNMMDWFPLFKWLPLMITGMYFIENINIEKLKFLDLKILNSDNLLTYLGKNSLNLYTFHVIFLIIFFNIIRNNYSWFNK
jgi:uncharacterized membrane protein